MLFNGDGSFSSIMSFHFILAQGKSPLVQHPFMNSVSQHMNIYTLCSCSWSKDLYCLIIACMSWAHWFIQHFSNGELLLMQVVNIRSSRERMCKLGRGIAVWTYFEPYLVDYRKYSKCTAYRKGNKGIHMLLLYFLIIQLVKFMQSHLRLSTPYIHMISMTIWIPVCNLQGQKCKRVTLLN